VRIGLLTDGYRPGVNGVIRLIIQHKRALEELGHQVFVFTCGRPDPEDEPEVIRSPGMPFLKPGYTIGLRYTRAAQAVLRTLDLLHAHQPALSGWLALRYGRRYDLPVVCTAHTRYDLLAATRLSFLPPSFLRAVLRLYMGWFTRRCDLLTAPTPQAAQVMYDLGAARPIAVVPTGIETAAYRHPRRRLTRQDLGLSEDAPLSVFIGRLEPEKNLPFLLEALARPEAGRSNLLLVGEGPERQPLETLAARLGLNGRVHFAGQVEAADLPDYIALADLFVTASRIEVMPLTVLEALAGGLPIVGPDLPWIWSAVQPQVNGLLAPVEAEPFARVWGTVASDPHLRARLAAGARASSERYDVRNTTALMVEHYQQVIEKHRRRR